MTLRELLNGIVAAPLTVTRQSEEYRIINQAEVDLNVANYQVGLLRKALSMYADPAFYDDQDLPATSKASVDKGAHADWILRMTNLDSELPF